MARAHVGNFLGPQGPQGEIGPQGETGPQGPKGETGATGTSFRPRGEWNATAQYIANDQYVDIVTHEGSTWICKAENAGKEPTEGQAEWELMAKGIDTGADISTNTVTFEPPSTYTEPASGHSMSEHMGRMVRGVRNLFSNIGNLASLLTTDKASVVAAINEVKTATDTLNSSLEHIEFGEGSIEVSKANTVYTVNITFAKSYQSKPFVIVGATTSAPLKVSVGTMDCLTTGFAITMARTDTATTGYRWVAIGK